LTGFPLAIEIKEMKLWENIVRLLSKGSGQTEVKDAEIGTTTAIAANTDETNKGDATTS
jgi:hypothetical protein